MHPHTKVDKAIPTFTSKLNSTIILHVHCWINWFIYISLISETTYLASVIKAVFHPHYNLRQVNLRFTTDVLLVMGAENGQSVGLAKLYKCGSSAKSEASAGKWFRFNQTALIDEDYRYSPNRPRRELQRSIHLTILWYTQNGMHTIDYYYDSTEDTVGNQNLPLHTHRILDPISIISWLLPRLILLHGPRFYTKGVNLRHVFLQAFIYHSMSL